jgi:urease accessory protein
VLATGALHMVGIALGALHKVPKGDYVIRAAGVVIALAGGAYLTGLA